MNARESCLIVSFQHYVVGDEAGFYQKALDVVVDNGTMPPTAMVIVYGMLFPASHLGEDDGKEMLLALSIVLLQKLFGGEAAIELAFSH
jgi:hypothetical protein